MPSSPVIPFIALFAAIAITVGIVQLVRDRRRRDALAVIARDSGLGFAPDGRGHLPGTLSAMPLLRRGHAHRVRNLLHGTVADLQVLVFDFAYTIGHGKNSQRHRQTVAAVGLPVPRLPVFEVRLSASSEKLAALVGGQDIDFPSHPEFSRRYRVRGGDESAVRSLFSDTIMRRFELQRGLSLEGGGAWMLLYSHGRVVPAPDVGRWLEESCEVAIELDRAAA